MKYTKEATDRLIELYKSSISTQEIAQQFSVPERSVIAKLSSLGVYRRKEYRNKRGEIPIKKDRYIEDLAQVLGVDVDRLDSLEKCNKNVLILILSALKEKSGT